MGWTVPRAKNNSIHVKSHIRNEPDFVRVSFPHRVRVRLESTTGTATAVVPVASTAGRQTSWYSPQKGQGSPIHGRHGKHRSARRFRVLCAGKAPRDKNLSGCHLLLSSVSPPCSRIHDKQGKHHGARGFRMSLGNGHTIGPRAGRAVRSKNPSGCHHSLSAQSKRRSDHGPWPAATKTDGIAPMKFALLLGIPHPISDKNVLKNQSKTLAASSGASSSRRPNVSRSPEGHRSSGTQRLANA